MITRVSKTHLHPSVSKLLLIWPLDLSFQADLWSFSHVSVELFNCKHLVGYNRGKLLTAWDILACGLLHLRDDLSSTFVLNGLSLNTNVDHRVVDSGHFLEIA